MLPAVLVVVSLVAAMPRPAELAKGQDGVRTLSPHGKHLYWLTDDGSGNGALSKVELPGGAVIRVADELKLVGPLAIDAAGPLVAVGAKVMRVDARGALHELADSSFPESGGTVFKYPLGLASDGRTVYWTTGDLLLSVPRGGGQRKEVARELEGVTEVLIDGQALYLLGTGAPGKPSGHGALLRVEPATGSTTILARGLDAPARLQQNAEALYWIEGGNRIVRLPKRGGVAPAEVARGTIRDLALEGGGVYWLSDEGRGAVFRANSDGSGAVAIAERLDSPMVLSAAGGQLFWAGGATGAIFRLPAPNQEQLAAAPKPPAPTAGGVEERNGERIFTNESLGFRLRVPVSWEATRLAQDDPDGTLNEDGSVTFSGSLSSSAPERWNAVSVTAPSKQGVHRMSVYAHLKPGLELAGAGARIEERARRFRAKVAPARELKLPDGTPAILVAYELGPLKARVLAVVKNGIRYELALTGGMEGQSISDAPLLELAGRFSTFPPKRD